MTATQREEGHDQGEDDEHQANAPVITDCQWRMREEGGAWLGP
jgi:hypothetical protein